MVQFNSGEPIPNPALPALINHALGRGVDVEVFTNMVITHLMLCDALTQAGVRLATSYYSMDTLVSPLRVARNRKTPPLR